jgi:hypothetical protein
MSDYELLELLHSHVNQVDSSFEFWLTATFAVIVAVHTTRESATFPLRILISTLYVSLSIIVMAHTWGDFQQIAAYQQQIDIKPAGDFANGIAVLVRAALYVVGTATAVVAIFRYDKWIK